jgi:hypothetical protein
LFGGEQGVWLFDLLDRLNKPLVSTLHTVLSEPSEQQRSVLQRIAVMTCRRRNAG